MPPAPPARAVVPFAPATGATTSQIDLSAVKQAIDIVRKSRQEEATAIESTLSDPIARKLVEWVILRSDDGSPDFSRYLAFIAANPNWPSITTLRRRAEGVLWQERADPQTVIRFFATEPPHTVKGHFALAQAFLAQGNSAAAGSTCATPGAATASPRISKRGPRNICPAAGLPTMRRAWTRGCYAEDEMALAGGKAPTPRRSPSQRRAAVMIQAANAKALFDGVPEAAPRARLDFSRIQWLRRNDKMTEAAQWMAAAPRDPSRVGDPDQRWIERRMIARKLLDLGDAKMAYEIADGAAPPNSDNYRSEQHFTAGWIALRFLREPAAALQHFARIAEGATNPIPLARSYYWQGRALEALGRDHDAREFYEAAARYPTAYYGQLARARLGLNEVTLSALPEPAGEHRPLEMARVFEILYAIDERDLVAAMAADLGDKATDTAGLATLAELTARHSDARATLLIGKTALGRGYPFERYAFPDFGVPQYQQIGPEVEPCVVFSIARQESAFNPKVVSSANAIGLMQVTPAAGRDTAKRFNVTFDQHRLASDVAYNAQLGTAELGRDIESWRGSYILAFVAYNAGPRRAKEWIEQYGDPRDPKVDPIDWIERIPISETRNYVQRILENMQVYRALIENNPKLLIEADMRRGG